MDSKSSSAIARVREIVVTIIFFWCDYCINVFILYYECFVGCCFDVKCRKWTDIRVRVQYVDYCDGSLLDYDKGTHSSELNI